MGHIKEPQDIDFIVDPKPLTEEEKQKISDYIKKDKQRRQVLKSRKKKESTTHNST